MKSLYESILDTDNDIQDKIDSDVIRSKFTNIINLHLSGATSYELEKPLNDLWKELDLEIPGMKWYFTRYEGIQYGPERGLCVPIVTLDKDDDTILLYVYSRQGIDFKIRELNLPQWEKVAKQETRKMTDAFLKRYSKKMGKALNMKPDEGDFKYHTAFYSWK